MRSTKPGFLSKSYQNEFPCYLGIVPMSVLTVISCPHCPWFLGDRSEVNGERRSPELGGDSPRQACTSTFRKSGCVTRGGGMALLLPSELSEVKCRRRAVWRCCSSFSERQPTRDKAGEAICLPAWDRNPGSLQVAGQDVGHQCPADKCEQCPGTVLRADPCGLCLWRRLWSCGFQA
jgi:hypothetical protein